MGLKHVLNPTYEKSVLEDKEFAGMGTELNVDKDSKLVQALIYRQR